MTHGNASIIIRTQNEERWIGHCLKKVFQQDYSPGFEVIIVDNNSTDNTLNIARRYPIKEILSIREYLPGKAINIGVEQSEGDFVICLSAHCIPKTNFWLKDLVKNFTDDKVVGVYGRQVPVSFSNPSDVRELLITFGLDRRVQKKDTFFHNANSAIRRKTLETYPMNNEVTNIEDRLWAKTVIDNRCQLVYEPDAEVYHFHGIHHAQDEKRAVSTFTVINNHEHFSTLELLPDSMKPKNRDISCIIPISNKSSDLISDDQIVKFFNEIKNTVYIKSCYILYDDDRLIDMCKSFDFIPIKRLPALNGSDVTLEMVLKWGLDEIEKLNNNPEVILYADPLYYFRPSNLFEKLIEDFCYKGVDTIFVGYTDYHNYWIYDEKEGYYKAIGEGFLPRIEKKPVYQADYGLGCVTHASILSRGSLVGEKVGIVPVDNIIYTLKVSDLGNAEIISMFDSKFNKKKD